MIIIFFIIILTLLAYLGSLVGNNFTKRICLKVLNALFFSWYFRFCIQSCFDITIFSLISIKYSQFEGNISIFNLTCCLLMLVIINQIFESVCAIVNLYTIIKIKFPISQSDIKDKYRSLASIFEEFKCLRWNSCLFYIIFIFRRVVLSILIIFSNQVLQLSVSITFSLIVK